MSNVRLAKMQALSVALEQWPSDCVHVATIKQLCEQVIDSDPDVECVLAAKRALGLPIDQCFVQVPKREHNLPKPEVLMITDEVGVEDMEHMDDPPPTMHMTVEHNSDTQPLITD